MILLYELELFSYLPGKMSQQTQDYSSSFYRDNIDPILEPDILISQQTAPTLRSLGSDQILTRPHSCLEIIKD